MGELVELVMVVGGDERKDGGPPDGAAPGQGGGEVTWC
jgi:hypothetical protein